jgi:polysaccharide pyruvyl transferase WcaK-like protein
MKKILLLGSYGRGNVGDDAFLHVAAKLFEGNELYINSADDSLLPAELVEKVHTIPTSGYRGIFKKIRVFFSISHVVYFGGDLWVELYGDKMPRQSLYKMLILNTALKIFGKKIAYIGCGAGNISGYSLLLAKLSAYCADLIIVREERTKNLLKLDRVIVLPDLTINLIDESEIQKLNLNNTTEVRIGVSVMYHIPDAQNRYSEYIRQMSKILSDIQTHNSSISIELIPMLISGDTHDDLRVCKELVNLAKEETGIKIDILEYESLSDFMSKISNYTLIIGTRLHSNILAILTGVPALGIAYRPKVRSFFKQAELEDLCVNLDNISTLPSLVTKVIANYDVYKILLNKKLKQIYASKNTYKSAIENFIEQ